jgi:hypothetical protein
LVETPGAFFLSVRKKYGKASLGVALSEAIAR